MRISALILATGIALLSTSTVYAGCDPKVLHSPTKYPQQSQARGHEGVVLLEVTVDETGHVADTQLLESSGHWRLDNAARISIRDGWTFDIANCERKDLPATHLISVEYRGQESQ